MYNVRIFKYPLGWHIRVYSVPVGCCDNGGERYSPVACGEVWNDDVGEYETVRYNPDEQAIEPFGDTLVWRIPDDETKYPERSAASSMNRTKNRVNYLARSNVWDWFFTLTFNPDLVDSENYDDCVKKLKSWLDSVRRKSPDMRYIIVPEKHKSGRFHFHGLFGGCDGLGFSDSGRKTPDGQTVYNIGRYKLGWSTATKVLDSQKATQYICKYITKDLCQVSYGKKRFWASRNLSEADTEEYFVEGKDMPSYVKELEEHCKWFKVVEGAEITTRYFEVDVPASEKGV